MKKKKLVCTKLKIEDFKKGFKFKMLCPNHMRPSYPKWLEMKCYFDYTDENIRFDGDIPAKGGGLELGTANLSYMLKHEKIKRC